MKLLRLAAWTVWFMLGWIALAHAEPVSAIIGLISGILAKGGLAALAIKAAFGIALQVGSSLLQKAIARRQPQPGITGQVQVGGSNSISFIVGSYATAGSLEYINTGSVIPNKAPNNTLVQVISVSDLPVTAIKDTVWIGGEKCTRSTSVSVPGDNGARLGPQSYPLVEYKDGAYYYLFVRYFLGDQTAAMPELVSLFGPDPERPWQSDMIGRGVAWVALSAYVSRKLMTSIPLARFEVDGIKLYDPRKDTTVGGSGAQRWGQPATYAFSNNPAVIIYNILRGIFYEGELVYGPAIPAARLPLGNWMAAMNECDLPVQVATGTGGQAIYEPQYRAGYEIKVAEHQPIDVILELLKGCNGKIAETGGIYKIRVGAAALPVAFVSDEDFVVTEEQEFDPFPGLENTYNGATATYPEPDAGWEMKDAPQQLFPDLESEDDGRRLLADFQFNAVPHPFQVQRLAMAMVRDGRRFRKHRGTLPPWAFALEPLDTIAWTSPREGYIAKHFEIDSMDDLVNANQAIACNETDPSDFNWNFSTDALPWSVGPIVPNWPTPQPISGWQALPAEIKDADGAGRRPSIEVRFDGEQEDVRAVRITARLNADSSVVFDAEVPYGDPTTNPATKSVILNAVFLPDTYYTAEGVYVPFSSRAVLPSAPMLVKTPDIKLSDFDVDFGPIKQEVEDWTREQLEDVDERITEVHEEVVNEAIIRAGQIGDEAAARAGQIGEERDARLLDSSELSDRYRALYETVARTAFALSETTLDTRRNLVIVNESIASVDQSSRAFAQDQIQLAVGPGSAVAERLATIEASATSNYNTLAGSISTVQSVLLDAVGDEATARQALAIQLRGAYGGGDLAHVTDGLIHQLNQVVISETMSLANAIAMVSAGVGIMFDWSRIWLFDSSVQDWTGNGAPTVNQGWLHPADHATEPYVVSPAALAIDGAAYKQVKLYIRKTGAPTWRGQLWWQAGGDTTWDAARRVTVDEPSYDAEGRAVVTIDVVWTGTINRIRLDLSTAQTPSAYYEADWVAIGRPSPGASQAQVIAVQSALASDIMAEAASRQALSVKLTGEADPSGVTLGNLSSGLIYDERQARVTADSAAMSIITGVLAQLADPATGLDALAQAQSTMATSISSLNGVTNLHGEAIDDIHLALDGLDAEKASVGITDGLQAQIDELGGGNSLRLIAEAIRALRLTVDRLALGNAGTWLAAKKDRGELGDIIADVNQQMSSRIDIADDKITLHGSLINQIRLDLGGYATLNAMMALTGRVTATENEVDQLATAMLAAQNELAGKASNAALLSLSSRVTETESDLDLLQSAMLGVQSELSNKASNSAVLALTGRMTEAEGDIDALSTAMLSTQAAVGKISANGALLIEAGATTGDGWSRIALRASANSGVTFEEAAILLDARTSGTIRSRVAIKAGQFAVLDGAGVAYSIFDGTTAWFDRARIRNLDATNINVAALTATSGFFDAVRITNSLQLDPGVVITGSIASGAITNSASSATWTMTAWDPSVVYTVGSIAISSETGQPITFSSRCEYTQRFGSNNAGNGHVFIEFYYVISGITYVVDSVYASIHPSEWIDVMHSRQCSLFFKPPSPGTYTAELRMRATILNCGPYYPDARATGTFSSHAVCNRR